MDIPFARAGMSASGLNTGWFSQLSEAAFMTDFQFTRGDGSACGVLYMGVYRIRGGHGLHREIVFPPDARRDARFRGGCDDRRFLLVVARPRAGDEFTSRPVGLCSGGAGLSCRGRGIAPG